MCKSIGSFIEELTSSGAVGEFFKRNIEQASLKETSQEKALKPPPRPSCEGSIYVKRSVEESASEEEAE